MFYSGWQRDLHNDPVQIDSVLQGKVQLSGIDSSVQCSAGSSQHNLGPPVELKEGRGGGSNRPEKDTVGGTGVSVAAVEDKAFRMRCEQAGWGLRDRSNLGGVCMWGRPSLGPQDLREGPGKP